MTDILVEPETNEKAPNQSDPRAVLADWVMSRVVDWRTNRDSTFKTQWDEYYRIWRGRYTSEQKTRRTERSKIISPASQIAVDIAVSEIVEAVLSREAIFDISDDLKDQQRDDAIANRDQLLEDLYADGIVEQLQEIVTNGALYGQFIAKIVTDVRMEAHPEVMDVKAEDGTVSKKLIKVAKEKVSVYPVAVEPGQLAVDPDSTTIDGGLGSAHEFSMPLHKIQEKQGNGVYYTDVVIGGDNRSLATDERGEEIEPKDKKNAAFVTEYHGLVPLHMLAAVRGEGDEMAEAIVMGDNENEMVEAIVTIANGSTLLRGIANPAVMEDRAIVSEQFDTVPNRFWGRSVMEKGFNMQKCLDSELRARADALAWINNPMLAGDITKLPPGMNLNAWPGKFWGTKGPPQEAITELRFAEINGSTFQQANELERMHQQATGAIDPSVLNAGVRDQATGASAINVSGIVKRSKRTMVNLEEFLTTLIRRIVWRKMQYEPERYQQDYKFQVRGTIGIMARAVEQQQLVQMLQFVDKGTQEYFGILSLIVDGSAGLHKGPLMGMLQNAAQPPSKEQQAKAAKQEQMQQQLLVEQLRNVQADTALKLSSAGSKDADKILKTIEAEMIDDQMQLNTVKAKVDITQAQNQTRQIETGERKQDLEEAKFNRGD